MNQIKQPELKQFEVRKFHLGQEVHIDCDELLSVNMIKPKGISVKSQYMTIVGNLKPKYMEID
ncbi:MAG: hypothetical protein DRH57_05560 [Candidatus Cloacimonadota bacterium]|nr:MAG: hypothetical protein DRH57_05560 [Candidatus Cloacimonadota bacterium]